MRDVPRDGEAMGEVVMRGNNVMKGYFADPERTGGGARGRLVSTRATSAVRHPDGYIELRDRKKDIIISGGENISTIEVETGDRPSIPAVADSRGRVHARPEMGRAAQGLRRARRRRGCLRARRSWPSPRSICPATCARARSRSPTLPKTATGKIQKTELRNKEWEGHDRRIG